MNNFLEASEVKNVILKNKRFIIMIALICGLFLGGYKGFSVLTAKDTKIEDENALTYEEKLKSYKDQKEGYQKTVNILEQELASANTFALENPVMKLDSSDCEFSSVIVTFGNNTGSRVKTVYAWIQGSDSKEIFNSDDELLNKYKSNIINVIQANSDSEVEIQIYNIGSFDSEIVAKNVESIIRKKASESGQTVSDITVFKQQAFSPALYDLQSFYRNSITKINTEIKSMKELSRTLEMPTKDKTVSSKAKAISIIKFAVLGIILGFIAGIIMILYKMSKGGYLLSSGQIESLFDIQAIGDYSSDNKDGSKVLAANLKALSPSAQNLMLLNRYASGCDKQFVEEISALSGKSIISGNDVIGDENTIFSLGSIDGVIIGIVPGKTRLAEVQRTITRLKKIEKDLIGCVIFK